MKSERHIKYRKKIFLAEGYRSLKADPDHLKWWSAGTSIVHLKSRQGGRSRISLQVRSCRGNDILICMLNGVNAADIKINSHKLSHVSFPVSLHPGTNIFQIKSVRIMEDENNTVEFMVNKFDFSEPRRGLLPRRKPTDLKLIKKSQLVDEDFYKKHVTDLGSLTPVEHYYFFGAWENRDPNPFFSSSFYLGRNRDVYLNGLNPLAHYIKTGWREGRDPHPEFSTRRYLNAYTEARRANLNPLIHFLHEGQAKGYLPWPKLRIDPENFQHFTFSKRSHWPLLDGYDQELYGRRIDINDCCLKDYQDLLVYTFIKEHLPYSGRILDIGGGNSRILSAFANSHECWNIDKLEGLGNGPQDVGCIPYYRLVRDYMGNFNPALPDNYFDLVFSISALEHTPENQDTFFSILKDINRVLKPGGFSLHLFDVRFLSEKKFWTNKFVNYIFDNVTTLNQWIDPATIADDPDLFVMSKKAYDKRWYHITRQSYTAFGRPASLNILWRKHS